MKKLHKHLQFMLERKRPAFGKGWAQTHDYIAEVIDHAGYAIYSDDAGNLICTTEFTGVLFSCHLDTVHRGEGDIKVVVDDFGIVTGWHKAEPKVKSGMCKIMGTKYERCVLGADDAAGAFIMLRMIEEGYPGTYIFHNSEEIGCLGSKDIAENPYSVDGYDLEEDFTHAIAFDRKGTSDFIYHQLGEKMCSAECAADLIMRLSRKGLNYRKEQGLVTDTAMYADYVQECINLSVGYYDEHTADERLDITHVEILLDTILSDRTLFSGLPVARKCPDYEQQYEADLSDETVQGLVERHPEAIAAYLEDTLNYDYNELFDVLNQYAGVI